MIKPSDVFKDNPSMLEREIDDEIVRQSEDLRVGNIKIDMLKLPSFYEEGWKLLRDQYQQYWTTEETAISTKGVWITYLVVFKAKPKEFSMTDHVFFPGDK